MTLVFLDSSSSIRYTTDGSTPSETNGTLYSDPVNIGGTTTLKAIAYGAGLPDSGVSTGVYAINIPGTVQAPAFSPGGGTYTNVQSVTISSATSGVSIRYTTDGSTPSETQGTIYSGPVSINSTTTLKAIAYESGQADSTVSAAAYTLQAATPTFSLAAGTYNNAQSMTISSATSGASINYTVDGTTPTETHGILLSNGGLVPVGNTRIEAIAFGSGLVDSGVATATYNLQAATPTFSPAGGTYTSPLSVAITSATNSLAFNYLSPQLEITGAGLNVTGLGLNTTATINYTTDGSMPSETHGTLYSGPISISTTTTLSAIAFQSGYLDSGVAIAGYTIAPPPTPPTFSLAAGTYPSAQSVTIGTANGATIRYTTDGSTPTESNGIIYSGPVSISSTTILKAIAYENGFPDTPVTNSIYTVTNSPAAIVNVIHDFAPSNNGGTYPYANLTLGSDGNFYGTTIDGGSSNDGTIFKITPAGVLTTSVSFGGANGAWPYAGLVQGGDGNFYGTTASGGSGGGYGTVFKMTPTGGLTTLVSFSGAQGDFLVTALVRGTDGNFYGTTDPYFFDSSSNDTGEIFKLTPAGTFTTFAPFNGNNGADAEAPLVQGNDGNFYGTTFLGGSAGEGTIFKLTPSGALTTLVSFNGTNGAFSTAALLQGLDGNFYGVCNGDSNNPGTAFKMTPAGALTTLAYFNTTNGQYPNALVQASDGNFYGTTQYGGSSNNGTIFKLTPSGALTTLVSFDGANGSNLFVTSLVQGSDGNFYGTTVNGGSSYVSSTSPGYGVVFQLILPPGTASPVFSPAGGTYTSTQTVTITSATSSATIRYTTNGSMPTETNGTIYSSPVNISSTTILSAIAFKSSLADSAVIAPTYTIQAAPSPTSTPPASSGGGGAFDDWFLGFLAFAGLWRALMRANHKRQ